MIKKWSYVAAAMLTVASGVALTSCIDNDEPFGIREIRLATANLLDAKKAAVEAEAAARTAEVEIAKIKAEIEKLRIENEKIEAQANADYRAAEAEWLKAQAEAEKLRAEGEKAVSDAQAAELLAQAEIAQAQADHWKAQAEQIRKQADADYQDRMQQIDRAKQNADNAQRSADQAYIQAEYWFEKTKADNANAWNKELWAQVETAFNIYLQKIKAYNSANYQYQLALNHMAEIEADLVWVEAGKEVVDNFPIYEDGEFKGWREERYTVDQSGFYSPKYNKKKAILDLIANTNREIKSYEEVSDIYDEFNAKLDAFNEGDWAQLLAEYEQKLEDAKYAAEQAKLEAQAVKIDQKDVFDKPTEIQSQIDAFKADPVTITPFTIDPIDELSAINQDWSNPIPVVVANPYEYPNYGNTYYVTDANNMPYPVGNYETLFNNWIKQFTMAQFDENDKLWTQATLAELNRKKDNTEGLQKAIANWEQAKKAYNTGGVPDATALPVGKKLNDAKEAYNGYEEEINNANQDKIAADQAVIDSKDALDKAVEAYNKGEIPSALATFLAATDARDEAIDKAESTYAQTAGDHWDPIDQVYVNYNEATLWKEKENSLKKINNYADALYREYEIKDAEYRAAKAAADADPTNKDLETAAATALTAANKAYDEWDHYRWGYVDEKNGWTWEYNEETSAVEGEYNTACRLAEATKDKAIAQANKTWHTAYDTFLAAGGEDIPEKDPAYEPITEAENTWKAALQTQIDAQQALDAVVDEAKDELKKFQDAVEEQYTEMGFDYYSAVWAWNTYDVCVPQGYMIDSYVYNVQSGIKAEFPAATAPVEYLNEDSESDQYQVYTNAKNYLITTSRIAFGPLGTDNYWESDHNDINGRDTYDLFSDEALLIKEVTVETLNMYIKKMLVNRGWYTEDELNPFIIANYYYRFGLFGSNAKVLEMISRAEICLAKGAENAIKAQIDKLTDARDEMLNNCQAKMDELKDLNDQFKAATEAKTELEEQAEAAVKAAQYVVDAYDAIVNQPTDVYDDNWNWLGTVPSLTTFVENLKNEEFKDFYEGDYGTTANAIKNKLRTLVKTNESKLEKAQEALAYYQYQLDQFESEEYSKVENPYTYEVKYWEDEVARLSSEMDFWKERYEELQKQYESAKKSANYPD